MDILGALFSASGSLAASSVCTMQYSGTKGLIYGGRGS